LPTGHRQRRRRCQSCLLQQALLRQALPGSGDGGVRTAARLRLALVSVVVARWSSDLIVIFITFEILCTAIDDIDRWNFAKKNSVVSSFT
jgi:hypothetical protein